MQAERQREMLYDAQRKAFDAIATAMREKKPFFAFVDGPGGSGKTFLYEAILHYARGEGWVGLACAWSGIAAILLEQGRTCHSRFGLPVPMPRDAVSSCISAQTSRAEVLRRARVIIWDEAPMAPREALECADRLLRDFMETPDLPFGGKAVVLGGDFRQVLPVMPHASRDDILSHSIKNSPLWRNAPVQVFSLARNMRAAKDTAWQEYLLKLGDGGVDHVPAISQYAVRVPDHICAPRTWGVADLTGWVYPGMMSAIDGLLRTPQLADLDYFSKRAVLAPKNLDVDGINEAMLQNFPESGHTTYFSSDSVEGTDSDHLWPVDFLNAQTPNGMPPHKLTVARGAVVMLLRNLDTTMGLCNGVRLLVVHALPRVLDCMVISGSEHVRGRHASPWHRSCRTCRSFFAGGSFLSNWPGR